MTKPITVDDEKRGWHINEFPPHPKAEPGEIEIVDEDGVFICTVHQQLSPATDGSGLEPDDVKTRQTAAAIIRKCVEGGPKMAFCMDSTTPAPPKLPWPDKWRHGPFELRRIPDCEFHFDIIDSNEEVMFEAVLVTQADILCAWLNGAPHSKSPWPVGLPDGPYRVEQMGPLGDHCVVDETGRFVCAVDIGRPEDATALCEVLNKAWEARE